MKVVVLGGSGQSIPNLFAYFSRVRRSLPAGLEIVLLGRSRERLDAVLRASRLLVEGTNVAVRAARLGPRSLPAALEGADLVLLQARVGGYEGRDFDESLANAFGLWGDQEIGPGSLAAAWRSWPRLERLLEAVALASPRAPVLVLSSPVTLLVRASRLRFPALRTLGICEVPLSTLAEVARATGVRAKDIGFGYHGVSHFGWFYDLEFAGRDLAREYFASAAGRDQRGTWWSRLPAVATRYVQVLDRGEEAVREQRSQGPSRGQALRAIRRRSMQVFAHGSPAEIRSALGLRPAPWFDRAIGPLLLALAGARSIRPTVFLSAPNRGTHGPLEEDDVVELPHNVWRRALERSPALGRAPARVRAEIGLHVTFQRAATEAFMTRDPRRLSAAFELHPWVRSRAQAQGIAAAVERAFPSTETVAEARREC